MVISAVVGVAAGVISAFAAWTMSFDPVYIFWSSLPLALTFFVGILQLNPEFRYRSIASMAAVALVSLVICGSVSFVLTVDGEKLELPLIDFSVQTEKKVTVFGIGAFALLLLTMVSGYFDLKLTKSRQDR